MSYYTERVILAVKWVPDDNGKRPNPFYEMKTWQYDYYLKLPDPIAEISNFLSARTGYLVEEWQIERPDDEHGS